jgi:uncharacterized protein
MLKAVLDTNVVLSAHLNMHGPSQVIFDLVFSRFFRCFISNSLLEEHEEVLSRRHFGVDAHKGARSMRLLRKAAILVVPSERLSVTFDPDDNKVLECALEARAEYVVTGNVRDYPDNFKTFELFLLAGS